MYEHRCTSIGADSCKGVFRAESMAKLLEMVAEHARTRHRIQMPTRTIMSFVAKMATRV